MPWQSLGAMTVILTMFNVIPALNSLIQHVAYGKPKELGLMANEWNYKMVKRDERYEQFAAEVRKQMVENVANANGGAGGKA
mmetsp:Transcript_26219/g.29450  ORF Transcript_26219/g.29450 Transcript_26219/m.29450 type:complete len:82 (-) Transcript_26219:213-458(-)|eukprot:CAMPEP_0170783622 /NCGR_PEP_ID=MMETSP0733-20121128/15655_1 /TAXON_ID=186038 /ORGANISM="Fragilariopsis kerguelensis, Strain L26-C5" /LENGTH=81 /DNA_ID=CAMNT_0011128389 /DNA_START=113 /DNA_END=358 /DNA_ORIENTATION=+